MAVSTTAIDATLKIVVIGDPGVGKTSLLTRYSENVFSENPVPTIGPGIDFKTKIITVEDKTLALQIWDTAGQERFRTISNTFYKEAHGVILVYDVTDKDAIELCRSWVKEIDRHLDPDTVAKLLVGNKIDLKDSREVSYATGKDAAETLFEMSYAETSAKENVNVEETFFELAKEIVRLGVRSNDYFEHAERASVVRVTAKQGAVEKKECCGKK